MSAEYRSKSRLDLLRTRWVSASVGMVAMGLASLLSFHIGTDAAQVLLGGAGKETQLASAAPVAHAPAPQAAAPQASAAHAPAGQTPPAQSSGLTLAAASTNNPFIVKSILEIDEPIKFGEYYWDETAPTTGPVVVTVDLQARTISVFRDGHEIGAAAILKGYGEKQTPTGVFPITEKDANHVSSIYEAPMPYMMRLTNDGISIHGSKVERGYATNGCIGVPDGFARRLFKISKLGDKVIITDGKRLGLGQPILADAATPAMQRAIASNDP